MVPDCQTICGSFHPSSFKPVINQPSARQNSQPFQPLAIGLSQSGPVMHLGTEFHKGNLSFKGLGFFKIIIIRIHILQDHVEHSVMKAVV